MTSSGLELVQQVISPWVFPDLILARQEEHCSTHFHTMTTMLAINDFFLTLTASYTYSHTDVYDYKCTLKIVNILRQFVSSVYSRKLRYYYSWIQHVRQSYKLISISVERGFGVRMRLKSKAECICNLYDVKPWTSRSLNFHQKFLTMQLALLI
jgi:hypothetical protein